MVKGLLNYILLFEYISIIIIKKEAYNSSIK